MFHWQDATGALKKQQLLHGWAEILQKMLKNICFQCFVLQLHNL
jgi:hypothetical protein